MDRYYFACKGCAVDFASTAAVLNHLTLTGHVVTLNDRARGVVVAETTPDEDADEDVSDAINSDLPVEGVCGCCGLEFADCECGSEE